MLLAASFYTKHGVKDGKDPFINNCCSCFFCFKVSNIQNIFMWPTLCGFLPEGYCPTKRAFLPLAGALICRCCKRFCNYRISDSPSNIMVKKLRIVFLWWEKLDLNQRRPKPAGLQPAPIDLSGTLPCGGTSRNRI